jgi:hypothetical protein
MRFKASRYTQVTPLQMSCELGHGGRQFGPCLLLVRLLPKKRTVLGQALPFACPSCAEVLSQCRCNAIDLQRATCSPSVVMPARHSVPRDHP